MKSLRLAAGLAWLAWHAIGGSAQALAAPAPEPAELAGARQAYRQCALFKLPSGPAPGVRPERRAAAAVEACEAERLALAGHFALAHPGSRHVERYSEQARQALTDELAGALSDLENRKSATAR